ncbi:RNA polymerase sigma factor [Nakamurella endophytica]|uniref:RNA polymerase subunit sigma-24 n=1 Tax=Nakamurella endophytica TaxID=1748367 RepID=A0A917WLS3_9ACTN|nr:DUF6596 domain-containing protein [Nakamurella endophytica]GGM14206.1 RNA polymerase subunit sigma-24 [Nakamurella endophytica]
MTAAAPSMPEVAAAAAAARVELSGRVLAATLRSVRDLDIAEESTADAFVQALVSWPRSGIPESVEAWLVTAARRRAVDRVRRAQVARRALVTLAGGWSAVEGPEALVAEAAVVGDDELRMVVLCCDPRLTEPDRVALTLRLACGVSTAAIAAAHGVPTPTMAARLTRAKARLAAAGPALDLPDDATVDARLPAVARVVHLAFTVGHTATAGPALVDDVLADHAQYLASVLHRLRPRVPAFAGLLALVQLTRARAGGRFGSDGGQVLLADADRGRWDRALVDRGLTLAAAALAQDAGDPYVLQAAIAAAHAVAPTFADTDWAAVVSLYSRLLAVDPSPGFALGRSVALSWLQGPAAGLADLDELLSLGVLARSPYAAAARGDLLDRLGRAADAAREWRRAAELARTDAERDWFGARAGGSGSRP